MHCAEITDQINAWLADHRGCNVDGDCAGTGAYGPLWGTRTPPLGDTTCWPQEVLSTDGVSEFDSLLQQLNDSHCDGPTNICTGYFPTPACRDHVCSDS